MLTLAHLLSVLSGARYAKETDPAAVTIADVTADSRAAGPGALFVAVAGGRADGHRYIRHAVAQGAAAVMGTVPRDQLLADGAIKAGVPYIEVLDSRLALATCAAALQGFPSRELAVIGVTGTDGKTTTCTLIEAILKAASATPAAPEGRVGVITTVSARIGGVEIDTGFHVTTPDAPQVQRFLRQMVDAGCAYAVVESTSHGLHQGRVAAVDFDIAAVTNITHEHLDYHGTRDAYVAAKALLFRSLYRSPAKRHAPRCAVLNADDPGSYGALLAVLNEETAANGFPIPVRSYGIAGPHPVALDVAAADVIYATDATRFTARWWGGAFPLESKLIGEFNVSNVLCAVTTALALGIAPDAIQRGIQQMAGVNGRMERIDGAQDFLAVVDFAHTPVSLERALHTLRPLVSDGDPPGRLIAVFGSAGLRDRAKRYLMGRVGGQLADFTVITAEDPRTEDLGAICREIERGVREFADAGRYTIVHDRTAAIQYAVDMARPGDVVASFGKGHERSMCFGEVETPWSDQAAMRSALTSRAARQPAQ
jgi:UDP-N-acetylmuramoyl-L-alanyl-D-glutamate--2,6-diaminopimelate ligase